MCIRDSVARDPWVGVLMAAFFAVWDDTIMFGQRTLADGAGLMFFSLCALASVLAYQRKRALWWALALTAGLLAGLSKYNYFPILFLPALVAGDFLLRRPRLLLYGLVPSFLLSLFLLYGAAQTVSVDDLYYNYLNETAQLEGDLRALQVRGYEPTDPEWRALYWRYPLTLTTRLETNYRIIRDFLPPFVLPMVLVGLLVGWQTPRLDKMALLALGAMSLTFLLAFSLFRVAEGRQFFGIVLLWSPFWALGLRRISRFSPLGGAALVGLLLVPMGLSAWAQNRDYTKPDTRIATVEWLVAHARDGTGVAVENIPYEFWTQNGYPYTKSLHVVSTYRLWEYTPIEWENQGFYYLVADADYAWRGGFYAGHPQQDAWLPFVEEVARFEGAAYAGPDRLILRAFRPQTKVDALFGTLVRLYGYDVDPWRLGETLNLKYYWWVKQPDGRLYIMFNHLIHVETGELVAQIDRPIGNNGQSPSPNWQVNEWVFDELSFELPPDAPPGLYEMHVGVYEANTGQRLPLPDAPDGLLTLFRLQPERATP
jgi:hypothetical protein